MTTILVVEDDRATSGLLKTIFEMEGMQVLVCPDPDQVMGVARQERPDLIFMDYHLAEIESLLLLEEMKQDDVLKETPVLMTSGLDRSQECEKAGAAGFVLKPFRPASLVAVIQDVLSNDG